MPTKPLRACAEPKCPNLVRGGSRCPAHQIPAVDRGTRQQRGYTNEWFRIVAQAIREQPWCSLCGEPERPGDPLTGDHITARSRGGPSTRENCQVAHRSCNSRRGNRG